VRGGPLAVSLADTGRIVSPRQLHLGLVAAMGRLAGSSRTRFMNAPDDIALAFDKLQAQQALAAQGVPVPAQLGAISGYDDLRERMAGARQSRVFIKLRHGSAASGIAALEALGDRVHAFTTAEVREVDGETRLYNNRCVRRYREPAVVRRLVDALAGLGACAERWLAKASVGGRVCDLRVVTIAGQPTHWVLRSAATPFTNLHLGGQRHDAGPLRARMPEASWLALEATCRRVARVFSRSLYLGIDVAVHRDLRRHSVLEVNAFGDFVKGVFPDGQTPHDRELEALCA
jgi:glutathione synthase/RimK-type ligase-like ATP-grasp enzyme